MKPAETENPGKRLNKNLRIHTWCKIIIKLSLEGTGQSKEMLLKTQIRRSLIKEFIAGIQALSELLYTV